MSSTTLDEKGGEHSHCGHLHYDTVYSGRRGPAFRINKVLPSAGMGSDMWVPKVQRKIRLHSQGLTFRHRASSI